MIVPCASKLLETVADEAIWMISFWTCVDWYIPTFEKTTARKRLLTPVRVLGTNQQQQGEQQTLDRVKRDDPTPKTKEKQSLDKGNSLLGIGSVG